MLAAVKKLEFEKAALLRDQISFLKEGGKNLKTTQTGGYSGGKKYGRKKKYGKVGRNKSARQTNDDDDSNNDNSNNDDSEEE